MVDSKQEFIFRVFSLTYMKVVAVWRGSFSVSNFAFKIIETVRGCVAADLFIIVECHRQLYDDSVMNAVNVCTFLTVQKRKVCKAELAKSERTEDERCPFHVNIGRYQGASIFFYEIHMSWGWWKGKRRIKEREFFFVGCRCVVVLYA